MFNSVLLLGAAALALALANSPLSVAFLGFWRGEVLPQAWLEVAVTPHWLVEDLLMPVFFFAVGLEIRGEMGHGVLSEWRRAALPLAAALGGMLVPAGVYLGLASAPELHAGWGVPMATDIAFAVGILALLGRRVPRPLRVLLLALAVIDDLGAVVVIALFYSKGVSLGWLLLAAGALGLVYLLQRRGVSGWLAYAPGVLLAWLGCYAAGVHPTIAGVALGLLVRDVASAGGQTRTERWGALLKPWVERLIMPTFALANAGVVFASVPLTGLPLSALLSVGAGLLLGKPLGVIGACWLVVKLGIARLPGGVGARELVVLGSVAGVGFTMSLFVAQLAFVDESLLDAAKLGVVGGSALAALGALGLGRLLLRRQASV